MPTLVVAPHQDDESLACGGLIAHKRNEGLPVHVVFITDGSASHPGHSRLDAAAIAAQRQKEAMEAMANLGVERSAVHFLNELDGTLNSLATDRRTSLVNRLFVLLQAIEPGEIFVPCKPDGSSEHDATFSFVIDAITRAGIRPEIWQYPVWSWWNPLLLLRCWLATDDCRHHLAEDYLSAKQRAIECYQSQIAPETSAALPAELVNILYSDNEYFFRHRLPDPPGSAA